MVLLLLMFLLTGPMLAIPLILFMSYISAKWIVDKVVNPKATGRAAALFNSGFRAA